MKNALKSLAVGLVASLAIAGSAVAAPVTCTGTGIRSVTLDDGDAACVTTGSVLAPQTDSQVLLTTAFGSGIAASQLSLIERDTSANNGGLFSVSTMNLALPFLGLGTPNTFTINSSVWNSNQNVFLYVGLAPVTLLGNFANPDYFIFQLNPDDTTGTLTARLGGVIPPLLNANSFALVGQIPEPSSIALVALALAGLGFAARRRSAK
jgi:hypothetical protein